MGRIVYFFLIFTMLQLLNVPTVSYLFNKWRYQQSIRGKSLNLKESANNGDIPPLNLTPPLKIALLVEPTPFGYISGYANRFKEMLKYLHKAGDQVYILTPDDSENPPEEFLGFPIINLKGFRFPWYKTVNLSFDIKGKTAQILEELKPDILHVTSPGTLVFPAVYYAYKYDVPLVMSYHTHLPVYVKSYLHPLPGMGYLSERLIRLFHSRADLTLVTSPQLKTELEKFGTRRVEVWEKGIDVNRFSPSFRSEVMRNHLTQGHPNDPLLVYVGRLGLEKRLKSLRKVLDVNPNTRLAFVGKGPYEEELKNHFKGYNVFFAGQMIGDELSEAYASSDIFLMPSDTETLGFVVLEAMASGVPVVGVAAGGLLDLISDGENGYLAPVSEDMDTFSKQVKKLVEDPELRRNMGIRARRWSEKWSWESATSKLRNIQYRAAISLHNSRDNGIRRRHYEDVEKVLLSKYQSYRPDLG